ncbi:MAG: flagellar protein FlgN [Ferrovum sp.]|nr:flagellar protein FlgN [Ferrovum sp.]
MHAPGPLPSTLPDWEAILSEEYQALQSFVTLLQTEQSTLLAGQTESLIALADNKTRMVETLTGLAGQRRKLQSASPGTDFEKNGRLRQIWHDIRQLAETAEQLNRTNGELIQVKLRHNQQALTVLHNAANCANLYGPDGQQNLSFSGRSLGSV